jgi:hypothetical protein
MWLLINKILRYLGCEIRPVKADLFREYPGSTGLKEYYDQTEGMITLEEAGLLYKLAKEVSDGCIVEVGSYRGRSTVALGRGSMDGNRAPVYAVEPHEKYTGVLGGEFGPPDRGAFFKAMLDTSCYHVVRLINLSSEAVAPGWNMKIGLLWIDGDHTYNGVKRDFESWLPHLSPDAIVAFHDSLDPKLGPQRLIDEITRSNQFEKIESVGITTVTRRKIV